MQLGIAYAAICYIVWGLFPLYFKALQPVPAMQILVHRALWSLGFLMIVLAWRRQWSWISAALRRPKVLSGFIASGLLLAGNWFTYIWAVNQGRVVDASLGYFITPLVNVLLGFVLLREQLRAVQWAAIALAALGVLWLTWQSGGVPWIGLTLAATFGTYGLLRKTAALGALEGLALETMVLFPLALAYLALVTAQDGNAFFKVPSSTRWLLAAAGPITAIPLLMFASAARRIPLSALGLLQYLSPTIQLLLGVWLYHEPFGTRLVGFLLIWTALALYSAEGLWQAWRLQRAAV